MVAACGGELHLQKNPEIGVELLYLRDVEAAFSPLKTAIRIIGQSSEYIELGAFDTWSSKKTKWLN